MSDKALFQLENAKHRVLLPQDDLLEDTINQSVAKYLNPACKVRIGLFKDTEAKGSSGLCTGSERGALQSQGKFLSAIDLEGPVPKTNSQIQEWFTTYCHELRHMVDAATATSQVYVPRKPDDPFGHPDPLKDQYCRLLSNRGHATDGYSDILYGILKRTYPECQEITFKDSYRKRNFTPEQLQHCWNATNKLWQQTDKPMPMLTEAPENVRNFIPKWKKIFREGDPEVLASVMARIQDEMEAYRLCVKRAPGIKPELGEKDLYSTAVFLFLRDLMRLYYQERGIPKEQQHPYGFRTAFLQPFLLSFLRRPYLNFPRSLGGTLFHCRSGTFFTCHLHQVADFYGQHCQAVLWNRRFRHRPLYFQRSGQLYRHLSHHQPGRSTHEF